MLACVHEAEVGFGEGGAEGKESGEVLYGKGRRGSYRDCW